MTIKYTKLTFLLFFISTLNKSFQTTFKNCSLCRNETLLIDAETGLQRHISEVTLTTNCKYTNKRQILKDGFCRGTIFGPSDILTSASCFENVQIDDLCIYTRYLHIKDNIPFLKLSINNVTIHPEFNNNQSENDIAVVKVKNDVEFDDLYCGWSKLPDDEINIDSFEDNDCFITGYIINKKNQNVQIVSIKIEILQQDECLDIANINNISVNMTQWKYCVLFPRINKQVTFHIKGKGIMCKNTITALMLSTSEFFGSFLFPVLDVGSKSTWARSMMLNLRWVNTVVKNSAVMKVMSVFSMVFWMLFKLI